MNNYPQNNYYGYYDYEFEGYRGDDGIYDDDCVQSTMDYPDNDDLMEGGHGFYDSRGDYDDSRGDPVKNTLELVAIDLGKDIDAQSWNKMMIDLIRKKDEEKDEENDGKIKYFTMKESNSISYKSKWTKCHGLIVSGYCKHDNNIPSVLCKVMISYLENKPVQLKTITEDEYWKIML